MENINNNKILFKKVLIIGLPIALQNLISTSLSLVDNIMIGSQGEVALASVALANRIYFILIVSLFGLLSGMGVFTSQYWGIKDIKSIKKIMGLSLISVLFISTLFTILALLLPEQLLSIFSNEQDVITSGASYIVIACLGFIPMGITFVFTYTLRSIHLTKLAMIASVIALAINTILNYILINGKLGFPVLGVKGAAIATVISRLIALFIVVISVYKSKDNPLAGSIKDFLSFDKELVKKVARKTLPVFFNEVAWSSGTSVFFIAYGLVGAYAVTAIQVAVTISDMFWTFLMGFGSAIAVLIGNQLGSDQIDNAKFIAKRSIQFTLILGTITGIFYLIVGSSVASLYNIEPSTLELAKKVMIVYAFAVPVKGLVYTYLIGILRSGGDTTYCAIIDIVPIFVLGIPLAFISTAVLHLPIHWCVALVMSEEAIKIIFAHRRYKSGKWINVLTH